MGKKIAILYTGEFRTLASTIKLFKQNVLLNDNYHVFGVIQTNGIPESINIIKNNIGDNLKKFIDFNINDAEWVELREHLISQMNITDGWKHYLRTSGSMVEYYQMHLAYKMMCEYEKENSSNGENEFKYDYVMRFRSDTIMKDPIDFDWEGWDGLDTHKIIQILEQIKQTYNLTTFISDVAIKIFFNTFYNTKRIEYKPMIDSINVSETYAHLLTIHDETEFAHALNDYIKNSNYIITYRVNVIYFLKRNLMDVINVLGLTYGKRQMKDDYWFNAECQLKQVCLENNIDFFSSVVLIEDKSLYEYDTSNYYDSDGNLLNGNFSFFIKRH